MKHIFWPPKKTKRSSWRGRRPGPRFAREFTYKSDFPGGPNAILYVNSHANRGSSGRRLQESLFGPFWVDRKNAFYARTGPKMTFLEAQFKAFLSTMFCTFWPHPRTKCSFLINAVRQKTRFQRYLRGFLLLGVWGRSKNRLFCTWIYVYFEHRNAKGMQKYRKIRQIEVGA